MSEEAPDIIDFRLKDLRDRLLNLTKSNKLLDRKFSDRSRAHFRIIDVPPDATYASVVEEETEFESLPPLETEPPDERTPEFLGCAGRSPGQRRNLSRRNREPRTGRAGGG